MAMNKNEQVQRGHYFAMVDEIDSILIDEARTPLIISGPVPESRQMYDELKEGRRPTRPHLSAIFATVSPPKRADPRIARPS